MERNETAGTAVALCTLVLAFCPGAFGKVIYVDEDANATGDGSSWQTAYECLQDALADANNAAKPVEIRVAQGTYKPDQGAGKKPQDTKATFQLITGVTLRGGYAGLGESDPNVRDADLYESILSGDLGRSPYDRSRPGRYPPVHVHGKTVVSGSGTDETAILDGFTISGGRHHLPIPRIIPGHTPAPTGYGAGMNNLAGSPTVVRCTFMDNTTDGAGAGMCNETASHPRIIECTFIGNFAHGGGGAIANRGGSNPTLTGCTFRENHGFRNGGAVHSRGSGPTFRDCTFFHNTVEPAGWGGAIYNEESICRFEDCTFERNDGAICNRKVNTLTLERCVFIGNSASYGGAIDDWTGESTLVMNACTFRQNSAGARGGALYLGGSAEVSDCIFSGNTSGLFGGAIDICGGTFANCLFVGNRALDGRMGSAETWAPCMGGAVVHFGSIEALQFTNCTFDENHARLGSAVYTTRWPDFRNCILRGPAQLIWSDPYEPQPSVRYSNIEHAWPGEGNIDLDPAFAEPGHWTDPNDLNHPADPHDPNSVWLDGDYHLKSQAGRWDPISESWVKDEVTSPCIDAGDPNSPIGYQPFANGGRVNMGAYGGTAEASKSYFGEPACETIFAGDLNGDCKVDWRDLEILSRHWLGGTTAR